jgi:tetratricopeptide (TPR) repeat protein
MAGPNSFPARRTARGLGIARLLGGHHKLFCAFLAFVSVVALGPGVVAQSTGKTVRRHKVAVEDPLNPPELQQAEAAIEKKDYASAEPLLKQVVGKNPANYRAWFDLGFVNNATGRAEESIAAYEKSVAAKPDVFESNLNLGLMLAKADQPDAEHYLRAATKLKPAAHPEQNLEQAWLALAHAVESAKPQEALDAYDHAAKLQPKDPEPHLSAASLLFRQNQYAEAEQQYRQALAIDPKSPDALIGIANIYARGDRLTEAADTLRQLVSVRPDYAPAHFELARILEADKKPDEAIAEYEAGLKLTPNDKDAQLSLAQSYASAGKYAQALPLYQALLAANPNDPQLHYSLGRAYMKQRNFSKAQEEFLAAIKLKPDFGAAYGDLAFAANENQNYEVTIRALDARAKLLPETPITYFLRATSYDHLRLKKEAASNYHLFLQVANGQYPDQEWQARHRLVAIEPKK